MLVEHKYIASFLDWDMCITKLFKIARKGLTAYCIWVAYDDNELVVQSFLFNLISVPLAFTFHALPYCSFKLHVQILLISLQYSIVSSFSPLYTQCLAAYETW